MNLLIALSRGIVSAGAQVTPLSFFNCNKSTPASSTGRTQTSHWEFRQKNWHRTMYIPLMVGRCCNFCSADELIAESSFQERHVTLSWVETFLSTLDSRDSFIGEHRHVGVSRAPIKKRSVSLLILADSSTTVVDDGFEQLGVISEWNFKGESTEVFFEGDESWWIEDCVVTRDGAGIVECVVISVAVEWLMSVKIVAFSSVAGNVKSPWSFRDRSASAFIDGTGLAKIEID